MIVSEVIVLGGETSSSRVLKALLRTDLAVNVDSDDAFIHETLNDHVLLLALGGCSPGLRDLLLEILGVLDLIPHLRHLLGVPLLLLLPVCGHLLEHLDGLLLAFHAISPRCSIGKDLGLCSSPLCAGLHQVATGTVGGGNLRGLSEDPGDLGVHVNELVAHHGDLVVSPVDALIDPVLERLANDAVDEVTEVAPL